MNQKQFNMCLYFATERQIAKEDIVVFKVLRPDYTSPFRGFQYVKGNHYYEDKPIRRHDSRIERGLHSFADKEEATRTLINNLIIVKMLIPKGTAYYEGWFRGLRSYASEHLIFSIMRLICH